MKYCACIVFWLFYWGVCVLCTGGDRKNLLGLRSYPEAVRRAVRQRPELMPYLPKEKRLPVILLSNFLLFTVVFSILGLLLKPAPPESSRCFDENAKMRTAEDFHSARFSAIINP